MEVGAYQVIYNTATPPGWDSTRSTALLPWALCHNSTLLIYVWEREAERELLERGKFLSKQGSGKEGTFTYRSEVV